MLTIISPHPLIAPCFVERMRLLADEAVRGIRASRVEWTEPLVSSLLTLVQYTYGTKSEVNDRSKEVHKVNPRGITIPSTK
ncbi:hypothetical protein CERZMDRAFT_91749 [Cercospora zeae-maydis SCOH1-5]|uniref:Uncharacterized protein n=1 Tax=Cercospora zeae-maydis SCOH1-5 TaxID=717836 RepID=A0A6A6F196_9PEZI|nr:hypothetical protein CERZMDRAFT_91749 [Cercospora zeae-maydis SCOH1-5]